jgi:hypothetical protein
LQLFGSGAMDVMGTVSIEAAVPGNEEQKNAF